MKPVWSIRSLVLALGVLVTWAAPPPHAAAQEASVVRQIEAVEVVAPNGTVLTSGGPTTGFRLQLPDGAACPGDSANDDFRVQSYMVPVTLDLESLAFDGLGPVPYSTDDYESFRQPLYDPPGEPFDAGLTGPNSEPGQPGLILEVPTFSFAPYPPDLLEAGPYAIGLACTRHNVVHHLWNAEIEIQVGDDGRPSWVVTSAGSTPDAKGGSSLPVIPVLGIALVAVAAVVAVRFTKSKSASSSSNPPEPRRAS